MTSAQLHKLCRLNQIVDNLNDKAVLFVRFLSGQSDEYRLSVWETDTLNKLYLDHAKAIRKLERMQL
jgi:hypothetical protein